MNDILKNQNVNLFHAYWEEWFFQCKILNILLIMIFLKLFYAYANEW